MAGVVVVVEAGAVVVVGAGAAVPLTVDLEEGADRRAATAEATCHNTSSHQTKTRWE